MTHTLFRIPNAACRILLPDIRQRGNVAWPISRPIPSLSFGTALYHSSIPISAAARSERNTTNEYDKKRTRRHNLSPSGTLGPEALLEDVHSRMRKSLAAGALNYILPGRIYQAIMEEVRRLDAHGVPYNAETYEIMLSAYAKFDNYAQVMHLLDDMADRQIRPSKRFFDKSLHLIARFGFTRLFTRITGVMESYGYSTQTLGVYTESVHCLCNNNELEHAIDIIDKMKRSHIQPSLHTYMPVVHAAIRLGHPEVAFEYLEEGKATYLKQSKGTEDLPEHLRPLIVRVLRCAAYNGSYDIVKKAWRLAIDTHKYLPDEGLCYYVLNVAGEQGDPTLGLEVIRNIGAQGLPYKEAHFAALVEAYTATEDWKSTLRIFHVMRKAGVTPTHNTARSMLTKFKMDPDAVHAARNALVQLSHEKQADIVAFNLLIHSYANNNMFDDAMSLFSTIREHGAPVNRDTVDAVLDACIHAKHYDEGVTIYRDYVDGENIQATPRTLSKMVALACTQDDYEDAFVYLEETKTMGMVPLRGTYYRLIKKLASCNDPRLESAIQEMEACGYEISNFMLEYLETHSKQELDETETTEEAMIAEPTTGSDRL